MLCPYLKKKEKKVDAVTSCVMTKSGNSTFRWFMIKQKAVVVRFGGVAVGPLSKPLNSWEQGNHL